MYTYKEKLERRRGSKQRVVWGYISLRADEHKLWFVCAKARGILPKKIFQFTASDMPFPAFSEGHFPEINTKEKAVRREGKGTFSSFNAPILNNFLLIYKL